MDPDRSACPQKPQSAFAWTLLLVATAAILMPSCAKKDKWLTVDPAFSQYIDAYTTGTVSKTGSIRIRLAQDAATTHTVGEAVNETLFEFSPAVKGKATWIDARTIEFKPDAWLKSDQQYDVRFRLGKVTKVPEKYSDFRYSLRTLRPSFKVTSTGLRSNGDKTKMTFGGEIETADVEPGAAVEKILSATQNGAKLAVQWQHNDAAKTHQFTINNIARGSNTSNLQLNFTGSAAGMDAKDEQTVAVPAAGDFKVLNVMAANDAEQYASVQFSDPLAVGQDLTGLITVSDQEADLSYTINGSEVKVFTGARLDGNYTVNINTGIKNTWGGALDKAFTSNLHFENRMPSVKIHGRGNILPNSGRLVLPFEAINLNAVDISIIKIFENNVPQFLQDNDLGGNNDLRRVAHPVVQQTVRLDDDKTLDLHKRQRFSLDIDRFLKTEPGAVYRVVIGFRPNYSLYNCSAMDTTNSDNGEEEEEGYERAAYQGNANMDEEDSFWERYDDYYPYGYDWDEKDNPCKSSYYNKERWAMRNIIASNIGLTAKRGSDKSLLVAVSNIISTEPMSGVELQVLDYQHQIIAKGKSGSDGFANIELKKKPWLLMATNGSEKGYLKLDDGNSLPLSRFDVSGEEIKNGIKGFIYGERGVWRPGDTMYLNCIIEDKAGTLPADHPVEMSLFTPQGQLYKQAMQNSSTGQFYSFKPFTDAAAPTGNWLARVKVGGAVFEKRIRVETVMPNRLKINVDFGKEPILDNNSNGTLQARWLFGATAKNLKAKVDASLQAQKTVFEKFKDYHFDNPTADYYTQDKVMFEGALDSGGRATLKPKFEATENAPGMLTANILVKVFEPGGSFSIDNVSARYSPYASYAGLKMPEGQQPFDYLLAGKTHTVQLADVDSRGNALPGSSQLELQLYKIQWRWWWDDNGDNLSNFTQDKYNTLIKKETVTLSNGKGQWKFGTSASEWGRYLVLAKDLASGHTTGRIFYIEDAYWQTRSGQDDPTAASMLSFTASKEKYNVGDEVTLSVPSSKGGRALISIENGSKVIKSFWQTTEQGQTKVSFKATADMAPNVYATVSLLQPHAQTLNDLPIRMYGSIPIPVEDKNTVLHPQLDIPASIRPEQAASFSVSEQNGREMTYTVALVDEGLLDLTRFKTPDPHAAFYAREALGVKSFDLYDYVIGAWGGDLERILTIGGDAAGGPVKQKTANRFKPVVQFLGPFQLGKGQRKQHTIQLPSYIGSVRAMVVAAHKGSYGFAEKAVAVKKPLMLLATIPRVLGPGETIQLPVTVFAMENNIKNVSLSLQANPYLEVVGGNSQQVSFTQTGEQMAYFNVQVKPHVGIGKVKLLASSGSEKASYEVELDIRNPNPPVTSITDMTLAPGQSWSSAVNPIGVAANSTAMLEISSVPSMNLQKRLNYLIEYPYGCIEQTTSVGFPQLVLNQLTDMTDGQKAQVERNVKSTINRLTNFQRPDGGFGYWQGASESDEWGSSYAGHFLLEAQSSGYAVSDYMMQQWRNFQRSRANNWVPSTTNFYGGDLQQAYRLYTLALAKAPELGAMNRLKEFKYLSPEAKWRLAAAYQLAGQPNIALDLISGLPTSFEERTFPGVTFGSSLRDEGMVLETLTLMGQRNKAAGLLGTVAAKLSQDSWYSTQTTAYCLVAIAKYCGKNPSGAKIIAAMRIDGKATDINSAAYIRQQPIVFTNGGSNVALTNKGSNTLYVRLVTKGQPLAGDSLRVNNNPSLLGLAVSYLAQNGSAIDVSNIAQGTDFIAKVTVTNPGRKGYYSQMALNQIFPSGWEILNPRMTGGEGSYKSSPSTYQDVRDDRVYTFFNIPAGQSFTYYIHLNASYPGRYFLPGTFCEAMYDNTVSAGVNGKWVEVVRN
jgi:alpha-2-macroglobulin